jgi:hypothetical protein
MRVNVKQWNVVSEEKTKEINLLKDEVKVQSSLNENYVKVINNYEKQLKRQKLYKYIAYGATIVISTLYVLK